MYDDQFTRDYGEGCAQGHNCCQSVFLNTVNPYTALLSSYANPSICYHESWRDYCIKAYYESIDVHIEDEYHFRTLKSTFESIMQVVIQNHNMCQDLRFSCSGCFHEIMCINRLDYYN